LQQLVIWFLVAFGSIALLVWKFLINSDDVQQIIQLEPHESLFHYQAANIKSYIESGVEKINFLEQHSR